MTTDTLQYPSLLSTAYSGTAYSQTVASPSLPSPWKGLETLNRWRQRSNGTIRGWDFERKLRRAARSGKPMHFGSITSPYAPKVDEALWENASLWRCPLSLSLNITTNTPDILEGLEPLLRLDHWHAINIDMLIPCIDPLNAHRLEPTVASPGARLRALKLLGEQGLSTRLLIPLPGKDLQGQGSRAPELDSGDEHALERLVQAAVGAGVYDVVAAPPDGRAKHSPSVADPEQETWRTCLRQLRMQAGLPKAIPHRG